MVELGYEGMQKDALQMSWRGAWMNLVAVHIVAVRVPASIA